MKAENKTIIFEHDFDSGLGMHKVNGHTAEHRADFFDVSKDLEQKLHTLNEMFKELTTSPGEDLDSYLKRVSKLTNEIKKYASNNLDEKKVKVNSLHGHGLEAGIECLIKPEFKK